MNSLKTALMIGLPMAALIGTVAQDAHAAGSCSSTDGTCTAPILSIVTHTDTGAGTPAVTAEVRLDVASTPGCTLTASYWEIGTGKDNTIKGLIAAYLAGKPVTLRQTSSSGACFVAWAKF